MKARAAAAAVSVKTETEVSRSRAGRSMWLGRSVITADPTPTRAIWAHSVTAETAPEASPTSFAG